MSSGSIVSNLQNAQVIYLIKGTKDYEWIREYYVHILTQVVNKIKQGDIQPNNSICVYVRSRKRLKHLLSTHKYKENGIV
jgi:hypothetical protein